MSITLTEIITVDEYLEVFPQDSSVEEDAIQSAINRATITLDGICGGMIAKVWSVTEETSSYYRTEQEHQYIKQATILQSQYNVSKNLDFSVGSENYSSGSNNYNETRSRADLVVDETIYQLLAQARVYNPNITTDTTIANTSKLSRFYNPSYDSGDEYITYNVGDNRYIPKNYTTGAGKYLKMDDNGNITYVDISVPIVENFYTKEECDERYTLLTDFNEALKSFTQEIEALNTYCDNLDATKAGKDYVSASTEAKTGVETAQSITIGETSYNLGGSSGATWGSITGTLSEQEDLVAYITTRLSGYATQDWVNNQGFLTEHQSLADYAKTTYVDNNFQTKINKYCDSAEVSNNTLTINFSNGDTTSFTPTSQEGGITNVQVTDSEGTSSVVTEGVATIDLTGYMTTTNANTRFSEVETLITDEQNRAMEMENGLQDQIDQLTGMVSTTYSELVTLRDNSNLVAGRWYRITDYVATTTQENTQATSNQYDIIVLATSTNTLSEEARAIQHSGDTYFANSNLNKWKVWYSLDNDTTRYAWADSTNGKGVVYHLIDEFDNDIWYDFKCIKVTNSNAPESGSYYYLFDNSGVDASLNTSRIDCQTNHFGKYTASNKITIGCNICYGGVDFYSNTIGNEFNNNTIGNNFHDNSIGTYFQLNSIGSSFRDNSIGNYFQSNTIGDAFGDNTIGNVFGNNTIGDYFQSNTIGNWFSNNATTSLPNQPSYCVFPCYVYQKITVSTTSLASYRTYYLGSDGSLKSLS